jgi:hypothetical protein
MFVGISALAFDPVSGALYVSGGFSAIGGQTRNWLAKLSTSGAGAADPQWNPNPNDVAYSLLIDSSGNLYAGGRFTTIGGLPRSHLAKISGSGAGAVDPTWDPNPKASFRLLVEKLAFDPLTGDVYAAGAFDSIGGQPITNIARLSSTGTGAADASWNPHANGEVTALAVDASSNVFTGGLFGNAGGQNRPAVKLSGTTAIADPAWNPLGPWQYQLALGVPGVVTSAPFFAFAIDASGNVLAGGTFTYIGGLTRTGFALLSGSGQGAANPAWPSVQTGGTIRAMARDSKGRTVIAGSFSFMGDGLTVRNNIARLNSDTTLDTTWDPEPDFEVDALALDANDNVYAGGQFTAIGGRTRIGLARLAATGGAADATWNPGPDGQIAVLAIDNGNGNLFAGGNFANIGGRARGNLAKLSLSGAGSADATWNPGASPGFMQPYIGALTLDGNGNLYVGGNYKSIGGLTRTGLARLSTSGAGAVDANWNPNPSQSGGDNYNVISALKLDGGGNLYVGGNFTSIGGQSIGYLARLSTAATGAADATWNPRANGNIGAFALDGNGHVYVGGDFIGVGGALRSYLARLFTSGAGTADCHWIPNVNWPVYALALDASDNLYVGGGFSQIEGNPRYGFAELTGSTAAGCMLATTAVNSGLDPSANFPFSLTVQSQDSTGLPQTVVADTLVALAVGTGSGTLSGTTSCRINAGGYTCTMPGVVYSQVQSGVVLTDTRSSGDLLTAGKSGPLNFIAVPPPARLAVLDVNSGADPVAGAGFPITVQAQDGNGMPANVTVATSVGVWATGGTGVVTNYPSCQIKVGASSCTLTGVIYSRAESGIIFIAGASYGAGNLAGNSQPVTVDEPPGGRTLTVILPPGGYGNVATTPPGISCTDGYCTAVFPTGSQVTLNVTATSSFGHWIGDCSGTSPFCTLTMNSDKIVTIAIGIPNIATVFIESLAVQATTAVVGTTNPRIDQTQCQILGRYHGSVVYNQTFNAPFADASVQAGVAAAGSAVRAAAHNAALPLGAPVLTGATDTLISTKTSYSDVVTMTGSVPATNYIGPQTIPFGYMGNCVLAPSNCTGPLETLAIQSGQYVLNTIALTTYNTSRTIVNTATHLLSSTYEVGDGLLNNDAGLSALAVSAGLLAPAFAPTQLSYADSVANSVASITVTPTLHDPTASVLVNGKPVTSGAPSPAIPLTVGSGNVINVVVTAQDGATTRIYTITVTRAAMATHFTVSAPATATAGAPFNFTVTALDQSNHTATGYGGTIRFTSSDGAAVLPANTTLPSGTGIFSATLKTAGSRTITATDTVTASITGSSAAIEVNEGVTLSIAFSGSGSGTVTSTSPDSGINCLKGSSGGCSANYPRNTSVTLAATPDWKSLFSDWSGDLSSSANPLTFTMAAGRAVTATFNPDFKAKLLPGGTLFASILDAYASVSSGSITIRAQAGPFPEELIFGNGTAVTLTGGMDTRYNPTPGYASVKGLTVGKGSVVIGNISIK